MPNWLITLDRYFPVRYLTLATAALLLAGGLALWLVQPARSWPLALVAAGAAGLAVGISDLRQTRHALLRNYPVIGHLRFLFASRAPSIRTSTYTGRPGRLRLTTMSFSPCASKFRPAGSRTSQRTMIRSSSRLPRRSHHRLPDHRDRRCR